MSNYICRETKREGDKEEERQRERAISPMNIKLDSMYPLNLELDYAEGEREYVKLICECVIIVKIQLHVGQKQNA